MERLIDKGVSVRKRTVKILRDLLMLDKQHPKRSEICRNLVGRIGWVHEEQSVKDLILDTFQVMTPKCPRVEWMLYVFRGLVVSWASTLLNL
jgi:hypothetical protein